MSAIRRWQRGPAVLCLCLTAAAANAARKPVPPTAAALVERAEAAVAAGDVEPARDLDPLVARLRTTPRDDERHALIAAIAALGRHDGRSPAEVKAYLLAAAPAALLAVARGPATAAVRADALLALRTLDADDAQLDEGIAIAAAATEHAVRFRGELLAQWKASRPPRPPLAVPATADARARERAALTLIERRQARVDGYSLGRAAADADAELVEALLDAGVAVEAPQPAGDTPLGEAAGAGCVGSDARLERRLATIDLLIRRGADVHQRDNGGRTLLVGAVHCPIEVMTRLLAAGAGPDATGDDRFSALQFALASGRWDLAQLLVDHGARLSRKALDQLFFEKPTEPSKRALLARAVAQ